MENNESGFIKLTGLWKKQTRDGQTFLAGSLNNITQLSVMPNKFKKSEADPDYFIFIRPNKKKTEVTQNNNSDL